VASAAPFGDSIPTRIIWVSPDGNDNNSGSQGEPLQSVQLAIDRATPGTAILLLPGNYTGNFEFQTIQGTADNPIWLAAANGQGTVTITAASNSQPVISFFGEDNLVIKDLTIVGGTNGIQAGQSGTNYTDLVHNIVIEGNTVTGTSEDGIKISQGVNIHVLNNKVSNVGAEGIDFVGVTDAEISGNEVSQVHGTSAGMFVKGGSSNILIANNYVHDVGPDGILVGGWSSASAFLPGTDYEARDVEVVGNVVENAGKRPLAVLGGENVNIHGNFFGSTSQNQVVVYIGTGSPQLNPPPPSSNVSIHDNVFDRADHFSQVDPTSSGVTFTDNVQNGVVEGDIRPSPPVASEPVTGIWPDSLLDAQLLWMNSARFTHTVSGTAGADNLTGTAAADYMAGGSSADVMAGGAGDDGYEISSNRDVIVENPNGGVDTYYAYTGVTLAANVENLIVKSTTGGTFGGNELNNMMTSGRGNDVFTGGAGDDLFIFAPNQGNDRITDFIAGDSSHDTIDLSAFTDIHGMADIYSRAAQVGANTVITFATGSSLTLSNVALASLNAGDFIFHAAPPAAANAAPTDMTLSGQSVIEGAGAGTIVGALSSVDSSSGETFTYTLVDDANGRFAVDGANLVVAGNIDYETATSLQAVVRVTDSAGNTFDKTFTIGVTNAAPGAPADSAPPANTVVEGAATGSLVDITAHAADPGGGAVLYSLVDDAGGRFAIDALTGVVTVANGTLIDYETTTAFDIVVGARDASGAMSTSTFTVSVTNAPPSAPIDMAGTANSVAEGAANGTAAGITAFAADPSGGGITYSLADDAGGRFAIDPVTGVVTVANGSLLDFETGPQQTIVVRATDTSGAASTSTFTVSIANVAPGTPADADANANTVAEGAATGTAVGVTVRAEDPTGGTVTYSLLDNAGGRFAINSVTGVVTVANGALIDYETAHQYSIIAIASDGAGAKSATSFTVDVGDVAPSMPVDAAPALNAVAEGAATGTLVGITASATDPGGGVTYSLLDDAGGRFAIDPSTGVVTVANGSLIDYEAATSHLIRVAATAGGVTTAADFTIGVLNVSPVTINGTSGADFIDATHSVPGGPLPTVEADTIYGNGGNDNLSGLAGNDLIDGGSGADRMQGGLGNDTYVVDNAGDVIVEAAGEGVDTVQSSVTFTLADNVENLTLTGTSSTNGIGNALDNVITGNSGNNILAGLGGADRLLGGSSGTDTATYAASGAGVAVSLTTNVGHGGDAEGDTLSGIDNLTGSKYDDTLEGGSGTNILDGGAGIDTVTYEHASRGVTASLAITDQQSTGMGFDRLLNFENITGSTFADTLTGNVGANVLSGLGGADTLTGRGGADTFVFTQPADGIDTVTDFVSGTDHLQVSASGFGGGLVAGTAPVVVLAADLASASALAPQQGGYMILDNSGTGAGTLYWDATGGSSDDAVAFAKLTGVTALLPSDFFVA
jgi:Ca2+-binding RTX toxin-like protein